MQRSKMINTMSRLRTTMIKIKTSKARTKFSIDKENQKFFQKENQMILHQNSFVSYLTYYLQTFLNVKRRKTQN